MRMTIPSGHSQRLRSHRLSGHTALHCSGKEIISRKHKFSICQVYWKGISTDNNLHIGNHFRRDFFLSLQILNHTYLGRKYIVSEY